MHRFRLQRFQGGPVPIAKVEPTNQSKVSGEVEQEQVKERLIPTYKPRGRPRVERVMAPNILGGKIQVEPKGKERKEKEYDIIAELEKQFEKLDPKMNKKNSVLPEGETFFKKEQTGGSIGYL